MRLLFCWMLAIVHSALFHSASVHSALVHPVHETVAEVQWNAATKRLEVSLRLDVEDEQWIKKKVDAGDETSVWATKYLRHRFRVAELPKDDKADSTTYQWIGRDRDGAHAWWYFEITPLDGIRPTWIDQQVLFDRETDYMHRLLILDQTPPRAINVTSGRSKVRLDGNDPKATTKLKTDTESETQHDDAPSPPGEL